MLGLPVNSQHNQLWSGTLGRRGKGLIRAAAPYHQRLKLEIVAPLLTIEQSHSVFFAHDLPNPRSGMQSLLHPKVAKSTGARICSAHFTMHSPTKQNMATNISFVQSILGGHVFCGISNPTGMTTRPSQWSLMGRLF